MQVFYLPLAVIGTVPAAAVFFAGRRAIGLNPCGLSICTKSRGSVSKERRFHRIQLSAKAAVHYLDNCHEGILGAISLGGAAINFNGTALIPQGVECVISVVLDETRPPLQINARITNSSVYRVGAAFINMDEDTQKILYGLLKKLTHEPETLENEIHLLIALS